MVVRWGAARGERRKEAGSPVRGAGGLKRAGAVEMRRSGKPDDAQEATLTGSASEGRKAHALTSGLGTGGAALPALRGDHWPG